MVPLGVGTPFKGKLKGFARGWGLVARTLCPPLQRPGRRLLGTGVSRRPGDEKPRRVCREDSPATLGSNTGTSTGSRPRPTGRFAGPARLRGHAPGRRELWPQGGAVELLSTRGTGSAQPTCLPAVAGEPTTEPAPEEARKQGSVLTHTFGTYLLILLCAGSCSRHCNSHSTAQLDKAPCLHRADIWAQSPSTLSSPHPNPGGPASPLGY